MKTMWIFYSIIIFALISAGYPIMVSPGENITEGNCTGQLDYFLCNCLTSNTKIDIHLLPGYYNFKNKQSCLLENKTDIRITGNNVIIECIEPFSVTFMAVQNVTISNIKMINCGDMMQNDVINQTLHKVFPTVYFGGSFRFAIMFYYATNVTITELTMLNTLGYGIVAFNMMGSVSLSKLHIENTTFENDPKCKDYDYSSDSADFLCSGSGLLFTYFDSINLEVFSTTIMIDHSIFVNNRNFLPSTQFSIIFEAFQTAFYKTPIPIQGAGSIAIFYIQNSYDVNTIITDT